MVVKKIRELCMKRIVGAVLCNVFLQAVFINLYLFLINVDVFHPLTWLQHWLSCIFSFSTWLYFIPLSLVIIAQGVVCSRDYISLQPFYRTRFSFFIQMFSFHSQRVAFLHVFIGFLVPWIYLSLATEPTYNRFIYSCSNGFIELDCFSEERMYLILSCVMVNVYYLLDNYFLGSKHLTFPVIQLPKLVQIKSQFLVMIKEALPYTLVPNSVYMILYYFFGASLRYFITSTFSLYYNDLVPIDTFYGLFSFKRLFYLHFLTSVTVASMKLMEMLFKVHLTERHIFPIFHPPIEDSNEIVLKEALQCNNYPIIQHLSFLDLVKLAENSPQRRAEIYKLSVPGGHPHIWNALKNECLKTIDEFVDEMSMLLVIASKTKDPSGQTFIQKSRLPHELPNQKHPVIIKKNICQFMSDSIFDWFMQKSKWINNMPIILYFFGELKEMRVRFTLRRSLLVMWSAQSLSFLSCYSLTEDNYGIVQYDLNQIITSLLKLKNVLDLLEKYFLVVYKVPKGLASYHKSIALKNSVKRSLYRMANAFKPYITDLQLSKDSESKMMSFVNYKE